MEVFLADRTIDVTGVDARGRQISARGIFRAPDRFDTASEELATSLANDITDLSRSPPRIIIDGIERRVHSVSEQPQGVWVVHFF